MELARNHDQNNAGEGVLGMKVLIPDKIGAEAIRDLESHGFVVDHKPGISAAELVSLCPEYHAMLVRSGVKVTSEVISAAKELRIVVRAGVGHDNIDSKAAAKEGIAVANTPSANTNAAAEHALAFLMMLGKPILKAHCEMKNGVWGRGRHEGTELKGKTLGIVGFGNVGRKVARVAKALDMDVVAFDTIVCESAMDEAGVRKVMLGELFENADYITLHVPLNDSTKNLISEKELMMMKQGVRIINTARGGVIDESALLEALDSGKVAAAALDVFETEPCTNQRLVMHENVICTPHLGASTKEAQLKVSTDAAQAIAIALKERIVLNSVNGVTAIKQ
ncbi:hydroxyacid dehydrogenase [Candidatus Woesearchaeota archaeon]|nr:hydroxyacid dehydrogenase [Candidatus Woesearchaeota archaeon]